MAESGEMVYMKKLDNFEIFPTMYSMSHLSFGNSTYDQFTALLLLHLIQKISDCHSVFCWITLRLFHAMLDDRWLLVEEDEAVVVVGEEAYHPSHHRPR